MKAEEGKLPELDGNGESSTNADVEIVGGIDDVFLSHQGGYCLMVVPRWALKAIFFARRQWKDRVGSGMRIRKGGEASSTLPQKQREPSQKEEDRGQRHQLCHGDPARVDKLLEEAQKVEEVEQALREGAAQFVAMKSELEKDVRRLQVDNELMSETHRAQLERLRRELETDERENRRGLESGLEKSHTRSMDNLRMIQRSETERFTEETKRLEEDRARVWKGSNTSSQTSAVSSMGRKKRFSSNNAASASRVQTDHETNDVNVDGGRVFPHFPESAGMSKSFIDVFYSSSTPLESVNFTSNFVGIGDNAAADASPSLVLLVLVAVPLFCLLKNWRRRR